MALINRDNSNRGIEMDNNETNFTAAPLGRVQFYNMTFVGTGDADAGSRRGHWCFRDVSPPGSCRIV